MKPALRKLVLTTHVVSSVGWLGAVSVFVALAATSLLSASTETVHAADLAMAITTRLVIVPLCVASLVTGVVASVGTPWGLFRYQWVIAKLFITVVSTFFLWVHLQPIAVLGKSTIVQTASPQLHAVRLQVTIDASAALFALLIATTLGLFKPKGTTRFARRQAPVELS
jgi:hypothetical protein